MQVLAEIVRNLLVIIMVASFLELLLPDGNIKPFARLAMGLFILIAVLNPALNVLYGDREFKVNLWDYQPDNAESERILQAGQKMNERITAANSAAIKEKVEGQLEAMALLVPGVEDVHINAGVDNTGMVTKLDLKVVPENSSSKGDEEKINVFSDQKHFSAKEKEHIRQKIKSVVQNLYGLNNVDIDIKFEGG